MKLIEKLNIDLITNPKITFASKFGVGKSTLLTIIAAECYSGGNKILFLTETKAMHIIRRFNKCLGRKQYDGKLTVLSVGLTDMDLEPYFKKGYDLIVLDYPINQNQFEKIARLSSHYGVAVFTSVQLNRFSPKEGGLETNKVPLYKSDIFAVITAKEPTVRNLFDKLLSKLMFWKKEPNVTLKVHKNRYGKEITLDLHVDFENVKIK